MLPAIPPIMLLAVLTVGPAIFPAKTFPVFVRSAVMVNPVFKKLPKMPPMLDAAPEVAVVFTVALLVKVVAAPNEKFAMAFETVPNNPPVLVLVAAVFLTITPAEVEIFVVPVLVNELFAPKLPTKPPTMPAAAVPVTVPAVILKSLVPVMLPTVKIPISPPTVLLPVTLNKFVMDPEKLPPEIAPKSPPTLVVPVMV